MDIRDAGPLSAIDQLLARGILAAADPGNVTPSFDGELGMCLAIRLALDSTMLLVPIGGAFFVNDTFGPVFTDASELWNTAAFTWNREHAERRAADTLRAVRRCAGEDPIPGAAEVLATMCHGCRAPITEGPCASDCWLLTAAGTEALRLRMQG